VHTIPTGFPVPPDYQKCFMLFGRTQVRGMIVVDGKPEMQVAGVDQEIPLSDSLDWMADVVSQIKWECGVDS
jgi:hypothetical protein